MKRIPSLVIGNNCFVIRDDRFMQYDLSGSGVPIVYRRTVLFGWQPFSWLSDRQLSMAFDQSEIEAIFDELVSLAFEEIALIEDPMGDGPEPKVWP